MSTFIDTFRTLLEAGKQVDGHQLAIKQGMAPSTVASTVARLRKQGYDIVVNQGVFRLVGTDVAPPPARRRRSNGQLPSLPHLGEQLEVIGLVKVDGSTVQVMVTGTTGSWTFTYPIKRPAWVDEAEEALA